MYIQCNNNFYTYLISIHSPRLYTLYYHLYNPQRISLAVFPEIPCKFHTYRSPQYIYMFHLYLSSFVESVILGALINVLLYKWNYTPY